MGKKLRTGIHTAPKVQERELIRKAKALRDHPDILVPRCLPEHCPRCPFDGIRGKLEKVAQFPDDESRLERSGRWGPSLARAYAATLLLALKEEAPYLAPAKTPFGTVHYARRGKAPKQELVGVQYHDVPELRLLTVADWSRKKGYYVYSLEEEMVTTCREDAPPEAFVVEGVRRLGANLQHRDGAFACPHAEADPALVVRWRGAGTDLAVCGRCGENEGSVPATLRERMVVPRGAEPFGVALRMNLGCAGTACGLGEDRPLEGDDAEAYLAGKRTEAALLEGEVEAAFRRGAASGAFLAGQTCFEKDYDGFLEACHVPENLREAFRGIREDLKAGLYVKEPSLAKLLGALDEEEVRLLVHGYLGNEALADGLLEAVEAEGKGREDLLREAQALRRDVDVLASLPTWDRLPPVATLADGVARAFKTEGKDTASLRARRALDAGTKEKVVGMALLQALEVTGGKEWTFREEERKLAEFLVPMARELLEAEGEAYRAALSQLITASGSGESLPE